MSIRRRRNDPRGQATLLVAVTLVITASLAVGLVRLGAAASRRARAQAAADATALAGAAEGIEAARAVASANGAALLHYEEIDLDAVVEVRRSGVVARARARWGASEPIP